MSKKFEIIPPTPPKRAKDLPPQRPPVIPPGMFPDGDNGPRTPPRHPYRSTSVDAEMTAKPDFLVSDNPIGAYTGTVKARPLGGILRQKGESPETPERVTAAYRRIADRTGDDLPVPGEITPRVR